MLWASPWTACGALVGCIGLATGGGARRVGHTLEFHGGVVNWLLAHFPGEPIAMTLGHSILGRTPAALDISREHELVHVRQYERWGVLFIPAYLGCSRALWLRRKDPYRDNPFEREAYGD